MIWCHFRGNQLIPEVSYHTSLWFQLLRWSAVSITGWVLTGGASAASFMKWQPESLHSEPAESTLARQIWREGSRWTRRNMEKSSALRWNISVHWWVHEACKSEVSEKRSCEENRLFSFQLQLLTKNPKHRLGCQSSAGRDVQSHHFFQKINFRMLEAGLVEPPFKPDVSTCRPGWPSFRGQIIRLAACFIVIFPCEAQARVLQRCAGHRWVFHTEGSHSGPDGQGFLHQIQHRQRSHHLAKRGTSTDTSPSVWSEPGPVLSICCR